jgi:hypothetical protein
MRKKAIAAAVALLLVAGLGIGYYSIGRTKGPQTATIAGNDGCGYHDLPQSIIGLVQRVEADRNFTVSSHGFEYVFEGYSENGPTNGTVDGRPYYAPPTTSLTFYSFGSANPVCSGGIPANSVVGALWIKVPKNSDGSYDLSNISVYYTPGLFLNQTAVG